MNYTGKIPPTSPVFVVELNGVETARCPFDSLTWCTVLFRYYRDLVSSNGLAHAISVTCREIEAPQ